MTPTDIALVREGFAKIAPNAERVGLALYDRLFQAEPSLRLLFRGDMRVQVGHLMAAVTMVVRSLDDLTPILLRIQELGARHAAYGVERRHMAMGGEALLAALADELGDAFTAEARAAWARAYGTLSGAMLAAMPDPIPNAA